jgi:hypothetical protein
VTASSVQESMAAFQRSASSVKVDVAATPILKSSPSMTATKDAALLGAANPAIRNRSIVIGLFSTPLILAVSWHTFAPDAIPALPHSTLLSSPRTHGAWLQRDIHRFTLCKNLTSVSISYWSQFEPPPN